MKSKVAETLRREQFAEMRAMTPDERVHLALTLGERALRDLMSAQGVDRETARQMTRRGRKAGRNRSRCIDERDDSG